MSSPLHSSAFWWTTPIVWNGCYVTNCPHFQAGGLQRPDCRISTRSRTLHIHFERTHSSFARAVRGRHCGLLSCERRSLTRPFETERAGTRPANDVAFHVGDRDNRVVERRLDVRHAAGYDSLFLLLCAFFLRLSHLFSDVRIKFSRTLSSLPQSLRDADPCAYERSYASVGLSPAGRGGDGNRDRNPLPSIA